MIGKQRKEIDFPLFLFLIYAKWEFYYFFEESHVTSGDRFFCGGLIIKNNASKTFFINSLQIIRIDAS